MTTLDKLSRQNTRLKEQLARSLKNRRRLQVIANDARNKLIEEQKENIAIRRVMIDMEKHATISYQRNDCMISLALQIDHVHIADLVEMLRDQKLLDLPPRRFVELDAYLREDR